MSKARLLQDYLMPGSAENENTLIANYWLEFVSARDERDQMIPAVKFTETDLREKVREFQKQMNQVIRNIESLRPAFGTERHDHSPLASTGGAVPCIPASWTAGARSPKDNPFAQRDDDFRKDDDEFDSKSDLRKVPQNGISGLLLKLLGK
jgi:hypothetical protein